MVLHVGFERLEAPVWLGPVSDLAVDILVGTPLKNCSLGIVYIFGKITFCSSRPT